MRTFERHIEGQGLTLFAPEDPFGKERAACGIGAVVDRQGNATKTVVNLVLQGLCDLDLRGAEVDESGDGAGVIFRTAGLRSFLKQFIPIGTHVPDKKELHAGNFFITPGEGLNLPVVIGEIGKILGDHGFRVLGHRTSEGFTGQSDAFHLNTKDLGARTILSLPIYVQLFFANEFNDDADVTYSLHQAKLRLSNQMKSVYAVSLEKGTATWKAMATGAQVKSLYASDFNDERFVTDAAAFHDRFATNVLSRPELAQPFRRLMHNGEINTIRALRAALQDLERSLRMKDSVLMREGSDSGDIDRLASLFYAHGVPIAETLRRIFQPTTDDIAQMPEAIKQYHYAVREALGPLSAAEGPAGIIAMDEHEVVGLLDGYGLRPMRLILTTDGLAILTSEIGAPEIPLNRVLTTFQLDAGEMVRIKKDGTVLFPEEADLNIVEETNLNYKELAQTDGRILLLPGKKYHGEKKEKPETIIKKWNLFGGDQDLHRLMSFIAKEGKEPVIGMGNDQPLAVFSKSHPRLADYFHQIVAVVTNPPIDSIREGASMDISTYLGRRPKGYEHAHDYDPQTHIALDHPFLGEEQFQQLLHQKKVAVHRVSTAVKGGNASDMQARIAQIKKEAVKIARQKKHPVIVLSDRDCGDDGIYIPPALIVAAVHEELLRLGLRRHVSIVCDTGEAFEAHDTALLLAMGVDAVNPYLVWQAIECGLIAHEEVDIESMKNNVMTNYVSMLKRIMSKMGIASLEGYRGSKLMQAVGIDPLVTQFFMKCPVANIGGATMEDIVRDIRERGSQGEKMAKNPDKGAYDRPIQKIMEAIMYGDHDDPRAAYRDFVARVEAHSKEYPVYLRDILEFVPLDGASAIDIKETISQEDLFKNHIRGSAISHGALQLTAHRAIAGAFNELGGMSNSGEGGELRERNKGGKWEGDRSRIRQIASARFGMNAEYLMNADELEIKIGQGAKPAEGGHLPGFKVGPIIAQIRGTQVGIDLISPPTQHDMYSIEDLARLMQDLRAVNPNVRIAVKITANTDIGTVAVGVAKAGADVISLSGWEGGTGAAVSSAIEHTGLPLELSLAEINQALVRNGLRDLVKIRVDGGIKRGKDIVQLACLGADEFALGTALMVAGERCIFCHSCSGQAKGAKAGAVMECPTGITPVTPGGARKLGMGAGRIPDEKLPDDETSYHICKQATKHYLKLLAEDVRELLASLGKKSIDEIVGDTTLLRQTFSTDQTKRIRLDELLRDVRPEIIKTKADVETRRSKTGKAVKRILERPAVNAANQFLIDEVNRKIAEHKSEEQLTVEVFYETKTRDRSFGATLAGKIASREIKLPEGGIHIKLRGYAGQSLGFCNVPGVTIELDGYANDFTAMGQSGGRVVLRQPKSNYKPTNSIAGNAGAYGASGGEVFAAGKVGQRWGVRNCGATLISEGTGKFGFEYMTGGIGVDLRRIGNQTGSGMTGGKLFLRDTDGTIQKKLHKDVMVTNWTKRDREHLRSLLTTYAETTGSELGQEILENFESEFSNFRRVVPREHYINEVTSVLSYDFYRLPDAKAFEQVVDDASIEIMAMLGLDDYNPRLAGVKEKILAAKREFEEKIQEQAKAEAEGRARLNLGLKPSDPIPDGVSLNIKLPEEPYRFQKAKVFAENFLKQIK